MSVFFIGSKNHDFLRKMASDWLVFFKLKVVRELQVKEKKTARVYGVFFYFFPTGRISW
jgi:hypothetical protein